MSVRTDRPQSDVRRWSLDQSISAALPPPLAIVVVLPAADAACQAWQRDEHWAAVSAVIKLATDRCPTARPFLYRTCASSRACRQTTNAQTVDASQLHGNEGRQAPARGGKVGWHDRTAGSMNSKWDRDNWRKKVYAGWSCDICYGVTVSPWRHRTVATFLLSSLPDLHAVDLMLQLERFTSNRVSRNV